MQNLINQYDKDPEGFWVGLGFTVMMILIALAVVYLVLGAI